jgi:hypothetical protein
MTHATKTLVRWVPEDTAEQAPAIARRTGKPLFVDLYAPGCKGCEKLDKTTYLDREVADVLNERFVPVLLNARRESEALRVLGGGHAYVFSPVLIVRAPDGRELRRTTGYLSPQAMLLELQIALAVGEMDRARWVEAHRILDEAIGRYRLARNVPEAMWWRGVSLYRASGNDLTVLRDAWHPLIAGYRSSIWAEKADILAPVCEC